MMNLKQVLEGYYSSVRRLMDASYPGWSTVLAPALLPRRRVGRKRAHWLGLAIQRASRLLGGRPS